MRRKACRSKTARAAATPEGLMEITLKMQQQQQESMQAQMQQHMLSLQSNMQLMMQDNKEPVGEPKKGSIARASAEALGFDEEESS